MYLLPVCAAAFLLFAGKEVSANQGDGCSPPANLSVPNGRLVLNLNAENKVPVGSGARLVCDPGFFPEVENYTCIHQTGWDTPIDHPSKPLPTCLAEPTTPPNTFGVSTEDLLSGNKVQVPGGTVVLSNKGALIFTFDQPRQLEEIVVQAFVSLEVVPTGLPAQLIQPSPHMPNTVNGESTVTKLTLQKPENPDGSRDPILPEDIISVLVNTTPDAALVEDLSSTASPPPPVCDPADGHPYVNTCTWGLEWTTDCDAKFEGSSPAFPHYSAENDFFLNLPETSSIGITATLQCHGKMRPLNAEYKCLPNFQWTAQAGCTSAPCNFLSGNETCLLWPATTGGSGEIIDPGVAGKSGKEQCCEHCKADKTCTVFTYIEQSGSDPQCMIFKDTFGLNYANSVSNCWSGYVIKSADEGICDVLANNETFGRIVYVHPVHGGKVFGGTAFVNCLIGSTYNLQREFRCLSSNEWDFPLLPSSYPGCVPESDASSCPMAANGTLGSFGSVRYSYLRMKSGELRVPIGEIAQIYCAEGFMPERESFLCTWGGTWDPPLDPKCVVDPSYVTTTEAPFGALG